MKIWQIQEAKAKLTELVNLAMNEPQIISRHGTPRTIMMNIDKYNELTKSKDIVSFFKNSPLTEVDLDLSRDKSMGRGTNIIE